MQKVKKAILAYKFYPLKKHTIADIHTMFSPSQILSPTLIDSDFITQILPGEFTSIKLLYRHSAEMEAVRRDFLHFEKLQASQDMCVGIRGPDLGSKTDVPVIAQLGVPERFHSCCD